MNIHEYEILSDNFPTVCKKCSERKYVVVDHVLIQKKFGLGSIVLKFGLYLLRNLVIEPKYLQLVIAPVH